MIVVTAVNMAVERMIPIIVTIVRTRFFFSVSTVTLFKTFIFATSLDALVAGDAAVLDRDDALGLQRDALIMRYDDEGLAVFAVEAL